MELGVYVEVAESEPIVERDCSEYEHYRKRPKVELREVVRWVDGFDRNTAHR